MKGSRGEWIILAAVFAVIAVVSIAVGNRDAVLFKDVQCLVFMQSHRDFIPFLLASIKPSEADVNENNQICNCVN